MDSFVGAFEGDVLGLDKEENGDQIDRVCIIGLPLDTPKHASAGCSTAPAKIREISCGYTGHAANLRDQSQILIDIGDHQASSMKDRPQALDRLNQSAFPYLALGGDHGISYGSICSFVDSQPASVASSGVGIIWMDAHFDCLDEHPVNTKYSHATVLRRIMEDSDLSKGSVLLIGGHSTASLPEELEFADKMGINVISPYMLLERRSACMDQIAEFVKRKASVYFSLDIDAFDAPSVPGTGNREHGGLTVREFVNMLSEVAKRVGRQKLFHAADIVEFNPQFDIHDMTAQLVVHVALNMLPFVGSPRF